MKETLDAYRKLRGAIVYTVRDSGNNILLLRALDLLSEKDKKLLQEDEEVSTGVYPERRIW